MFKTILMHTLKNKKIAIMFKTTLLNTIKQNKKSFKHKHI